MSKPTDTTQFLADCNAGIFEQKLASLISEGALSAINHSASKTKTKLTLTIEFDRIEETQQVMVAHGIEYKFPTKDGFVNERSTQKTPMHVGRGGVVTLFPEDQTDMFLDQTNSKSSAA